MKSFLCICALSTAFVFAGEPFVYKEWSSNVRIIEVDPTEVEIRVVQAEEGEDTLSTMALRHNATLAINGGFYRREALRSTPWGLLRIDGFSHARADRNRGVLGFSEPPHVARIDRLDGEEHPLLNPDESALWDSFPFAIGATPVLIHQGKKVENLFEESVRAPFVTDSFPRSCIALLPNQHWLVIFVDGPGMTLYELQDLLLELGAESALNLCGGNSATLYYQGTTFSPTPCVERMIANAIIFK